MKKIIFTLIAVMLIVTCGYTYCFAEEVETTGPSVEQETVPVELGTETEDASPSTEQDTLPTESDAETETTVPSTEQDALPIEPDEEAPDGVTEDEGVHHTLLARVWEYVVTHKAELIAMAGDAAILMVVFALRSILKKKTSDISTDLKTVKGDASGTRSQQGLVTDAINGLIGGYNEMRASYDKYETVEDDRNRLVGAVMVQNTAILDILQTVYANSKNLPQGVKDVITLKYANALKTLQNDEILRAIVDSVHEKVCMSVAVSETPEDNV